jgi:hypothetical protein
MHPHAYLPTTFLRISDGFTLTLLLSFGEYEFFELIFVDYCFLSCPPCPYNLDMAYFETRLALSRQVDPDRDVVGWYATGGSGFAVGRGGGLLVCRKLKIDQL